VGIWSFNLVGRGPVTAVLHQKGEVITGSAKSDGEQPWNAVLQGALSANLFGAEYDLSRKQFPYHSANGGKRPE